MGGAPGGITFGLKQVYGPAVHTFFAEPTGAPCMTLGLMTRRHAAASIYDEGIPLATQAAEMLRDLKPEIIRSPWVFPSERTNDRPMSNNTILAALRWRIRKSKVPPALQGAGIAVIMSGIMALGFVGLSGLIAIN